MTKDKASLYYKEGTSDKEYHASVEERGSGFVVNFAFGRRGNTLQTGTKTQEPVPYEKAKSIFDKLVGEKMAKGYSPGESGTPYQQTTKEERTTGILPQLLNPIEEDEANKLASDDSFWMQEKFDGKRILVRKDANGVTGINRKGLVVALPEPIAAQLSEIKASFVIDGEACGYVYHAFDLLEMDGVDLRRLGYSERLSKLERLVPDKRPATQVSVAGTAKTYEQKAKLFDFLSRKHEGVVFKRHDAPYSPGRPASGGTQLKHKFYSTATCVVTKVNAKRSVALAVFDEKKPVNVGNVTIPPNHPVPCIGTLVEIRYLYSYPKGALYQPTYLGCRDDIELEACTIAQLKYKPTDTDEDA